MENEGRITGLLPRRLVPGEKFLRQGLDRRDLKTHGRQDGPTSVVARDVESAGDVVIVGGNAGSRGEEVQQILLGAVIHSVVPECE